MKTTLLTSINFHCQTRTSDTCHVDRRKLIEAVDALLAPGADVALFYFAGHGKDDNNDVVLAAQDGDTNEAGISLSSILGKVQASQVREVVIILDCCFSGGAGGSPQLGNNNAVLRPGVSLLTASRSDQPAAETPEGHGLFSTYLCGALEGGAADVLGKITLAGVYAYLSESFGPWDQRPTFKASVDRLHELRYCAPAVLFTSCDAYPSSFLLPTLNSHSTRLMNQRPNLKILSTKLYSPFFSGAELRS